MSAISLVYEALKQQGRATALAFQDKSGTMTGTELYAEEDYIPDFKAACAKMNMLERTAGQDNGFVCRSSAGRICRLIQNYDSTIYTEEPEELEAQWRFQWSTDPAKALPFIESSTSYYNTGDCCLNGAGEARRSNIDVNTYDPDKYPEFWDDPYAEVTEVDA